MLVHTDESAKISKQWHLWKTKSKLWLKQTENVQEFKQQEIASLKNEIRIMPDLKQWDTAI